MKSTPETQTLAAALTASEEDAGPLPPPPAGTLPIEQQVIALSAQVQALTALLSGAVRSAMTGVKFESPVEAQPISEPPRRPANEQRVKIVLADNDQIPPGGQFIGVDGTPYLLQANVEADVPVGLLDVLDNAIMSVPITDENHSVVGYRDRLRFPYRVVRDRVRRDVPETADAE